MEGICWNVENDGLAIIIGLLNSRPQPHRANLGRVGKQTLDRSIAHSNESIWLELQKAWDNISGMGWNNVLRATISMFHEHYKIKSCFGGKKRSIISDLSGVLILLATAVYIYFSAVRRLIVINHIQNKSFCLNNICVCSVYIYYVYINIHTYSIYFENIYVFTCLYYIHINYMINKYI